MLDKPRLRGSMADIMTLMEIKTEFLPKLSPVEKLELTRAIWQYDEWDLQMIEDCKPGGILDELCKEAEAEEERGETEEWP